MLHKLSFRWGVFLLLTALLSTGCNVPFNSQPNEDDITPVEVEIESVVALGRIEPKGEVIRLSVSNAADSRVNEIRVNEGDWVEAQQVIAVLQGAERRQADLQAAHALVRQRQAELSQQKTGDVKPAEIETQQATIARLEAQLAAQTLQRAASINRAQATFQESQTHYQRYQQLTSVGATSRSELDIAQRDYETAQADLAVAMAEKEETERTLRAQIAEARSRLVELTQVKPEDIAIATAQLEQAQIQVAQRQADLDDVLVRSPVAGQILKINTQIGEQVNTQQGIVELAQTDQMMVVAEVYETDIRKVKSGQPVKITSEYGGVATELTGTVEQIGLQIGKANFGEAQAANPTQDVNARVVTVKVRLDAQASEQVAALTGMQVRVAIQLEAS
ncbi:abc exporter membrane fusion family [Leptolyngbya sp. Heron Island J]|uniref:HlyD family efflux transporter periplasmic adaptor subunit n=1 Tax=Leptolyngbya sp. Heron Island J TaxID=1385935 RepID=UPI0003B94E92|nr:HlyD family efflux transporter periplasmic adaptor subunit [Leptolyngbya sp. Heron Island J]ESA36893.1 abc exporter membrane fusion family [Leptolyngbya sp. Heron Island J]